MVFYRRSRWPRVQGVDVGLLSCGGCGFQSRRVHGCLSFASVVCRRIKVSATGRSLVQRSSVVYAVDVSCISLSKGHYILQALVVT